MSTTAKKTDYTTRDIIEDARKLLKRRGRWTSGSWGDYTNGMKAEQVCVSGAFFAALYEREGLSEGTEDYVSVMNTYPVLGEAHIAFALAAKEKLSGRFTFSEFLAALKREAAKVRGNIKNVFTDALESTYDVNDSEGYELVMETLDRAVEIVEKAEHDDELKNMPLGQALALMGSLEYEAGMESCPLPTAA